MARSRPGDATESQQPGSTGTGKPLPAQREPVAETPDARSALSAADRSGYSDAELLKRHVDGDPEAFGELFRRHQERLWAVAVRTLSDPEDAADALQEAMISAFRRAASFRGESAVTTWLHRIVVNACLDRMRRRAARPEITGGDERLLDVLAAGAAAGDPAAGTELSMEVMAALRRLPRDQQVALVLVDMLEYGVADAAELLGVAQGTVKSRCARGRARLLPRLNHLRENVGAASGPGNPAPSAQRPLTQPSADSEQRRRNQVSPGSVLPAQKGGEEEE